MQQKSIRIGYQGIEGSNSEIAATRLAEKCLKDINQIELVPLVSSEEVIEDLYRGAIDYGVVATRNSTAGSVKETLDALRNRQPELVGTVILPIHHCLFKKGEDIKNEEITSISSHIQALRQTENYLKHNFPDTQIIEIEDTAIGAERLANGEIDSHTAVICSKPAGQKRGLTLVAENIEDNRDNKTEFRLFKVDEQYKKTGRKRMSSPLISPDYIIEKLIQLGLIVLILVSTWYITKFKLPTWATAVTISGYVLTVYFFINLIKKHVFNNSFVGYWKYYPIANTAHKDPSQQHHIPRIVEITEENDVFHLKIFTPTMGKSYISAVSESVSIASTDPLSGKLMYKYKTDDNAINVSGIALLEWKKQNLLSKVQEMKGTYFGVASKEVGSMTFKRISKREFDNINTSQFLD